MKSDKLFLAIDKIDDKYLEEASDSGKKRHKVFYIGSFACAAGFAAVMLAGILFFTVGRSALVDNTSGAASGGISVDYTSDGDSRINEIIKNWQQTAEASLNSGEIFSEFEVKINGQDILTKWSGNEPLTVNVKAKLPEEWVTRSVSVTTKVFVDGERFYTKRENNYDFGVRTDPVNTVYEAAFNVVPPHDFGTMVVTCEASLWHEEGENDKSDYNAVASRVFYNSEKITPEYYEFVRSSAVDPENKYISYTWDKAGGQIFIGDENGNFPRLSSNSEDVYIYLYGLDAGVYNVSLILGGEGILGMTMDRYKRIVCVGDNESIRLKLNSEEFNVTLMASERYGGGLTVTATAFPAAVESLEELREDLPDSLMHGYVSDCYYFCS